MNEEKMMERENIAIVTFSRGKLVEMRRACRKEAEERV